MKFLDLFNTLIGVFGLLIGMASTGYAVFVNRRQRKLMEFVRVKLAAINAGLRVAEPEARNSQGPIAAAIIHEQLRHLQTVQVSLFGKVEWFQSGGNMVSKPPVN